MTPMQMVSRIFAVDSNSNGLDDRYESSGLVDTDYDGIADFVDVDSDNDALPDTVEGNTDTDWDGLSDFRDKDSDNDSIPDFHESRASSSQF